MKIAKYFLCLALLLVAISAEAQQLRKEAFNLLNLDYPGLEKVKAACAQQQWDKAAQALLDYYRQRTGIGHPDINLKNIKISKEEQKWADEADEKSVNARNSYIFIGIIYLLLIIYFITLCLCVKKMLVMF